MRELKKWIINYKFTLRKMSVERNLRKLGLTDSEVSQWKKYIELSKDPKKKQQYINDSINRIINQGIQKEPKTVMYMQRRKHGIMCRLDNRTTFLFEELLKKDNNDWLLNEKDCDPSDLIENEE